MPDKICPIRTFWAARWAVRVEASACSASCNFWYRWVRNSLRKMRLRSSVEAFSSRVNCPCAIMAICENWL